MYLTVILIIFWSQVVEATITQNSYTKQNEIVASHRGIRCGKTCPLLDHCIGFRILFNGSCAFIYTSDPVDICDTSSEPCFNVEYSHRTSELHVYHGMNVGEWGPLELCPRAYFANAFQVRFKNYAGKGGHEAGADDSFTNGIRLSCVRYDDTGDVYGDVMSSEGGEGDWGNWLDCPEGYWIVGFWLKVEGDQGKEDDTAVTRMRVICRGGGLTGTDEKEVEFFKNDNGYGVWEKSNTCPLGEAVCGLSNRILAYLGENADNMGLTDSKLYCCKL